ncbi:MAG: MFS transporter [Aureispira sp.]|nr:MFS transporter [Aureispira sp.]
MKNITAIRLLLLANFISGIAQGMSMIAVPLYFSTQGQSNWFGVAYMLITIVTLFWAPYAGTLVDKLNRKHIFIGLNIVIGLSIGSIALYGWVSGAMPPTLAALVFGLTFWNYGLHYPCFYAFMQEITEQEHYGKIASYIEVQSQLAAALAGAGASFLLIGGDYGWIVIDAWELHHVFAFDAMTYFVALGLILFLKFVPIVERHPEEGSTFDRLKAGFNYLKNEPYIFLFGIITYAPFVVVLMHVFNLSPIYVTNHLQEEGNVFAISELFYALGATISGIAILKIFRGISFVMAIIIMTIVTALQFLILMFSPWVWVFYLMSVLLGMTNSGVRVMRVSYLFKIVPNQVMGRANGIFGVSNILFRILFLGIFALPFFHQSNNVIYAFLILTIFLMVSASILITFYQKFILKNKS